MKKEKIVYSILVVQGVVSLVFSLALFFALPHQFSKAIFHYMKLAPIIRNFYCATLLVTGLVGIGLFPSMIRTFKKHPSHMILLVMIAVSVIYGLLIFPLVQMFYETRTGIVQETLVIYRSALTALTIYLVGLGSIGIFSGYCGFVKNTSKKALIGLCVILFLVTVPTTILGYAKYYDHEEISLTDNLKYRFVGVNGLGSLEIISNDHPLQDLFPTFMNSLSYEVNDNGSLKNGQTVALTVQYDTQTAQDLSLDVISSVVKVDVSGLREFYSEASLIPSKIIEQARREASDFTHQKLAEALPGKETQVETVCEYYIADLDQTMDSTHALVVLYRISYTYQNEQYYYYRACHVNQVHSDALGNLELLQPKLDSETYRSSLCQPNSTEMTKQEAKAHLNAMLLQMYDYVEELQTKP